MRLALYGSEQDRIDFERAMDGFSDWCYRDIRVVCFSDYDKFIEGLQTSPPELVAVTMNGADGMEGVIAARSTCKSVPVLWLSDDNGFGVQSYRLGCAYFHKKPVSPQILSAAIAKCV